MPLLIRVQASRMMPTLGQSAVGRQGPGGNHERTNALADTSDDMNLSVLVPGIVGAICVALGWVLVGL